MSFFFLHRIQSFFLALLTCILVLFFLLDISKIQTKRQKLMLPFIASSHVFTSMTSSALVSFPDSGEMSTEKKKKSSEKSVSVDQTGRMYRVWQLYVLKFKWIYLPRKMFWVQSLRSVSKYYRYQLSFSSLSLMKGEYIGTEISQRQNV